MAKISWDEKRQRWRFARYENGKRRNTYFTSEKDALDEFKKLQARELLGVSAPSPIKMQKPKVSEPERERVLISEAIRRFDEAVIAVDYKPMTQKNSRTWMQNLYDELYNVDVFYIDEVKAVHIDAYRGKLRKEYKPASVNRMFQLYKPFFRKMLEWDLIAKDPTRFIKGLEVESKPKKLWDQDSLNTLVEALPQWAKPVIGFLSETGARPGQVALFKFGDYDRDKRTWKTFSNKGGKKKEPIFPLNERAIELIEQSRRENIFRSGPKNFVFPGPNGKDPFKPDYLYTCVNRVSERLNRPGFCPYGLRHTFGTLMVNQGVHLKHVAGLMGHSDTRTTELYTQIVPEEIKRVMELRPSITRHKNDAKKTSEG